MLLFSPCWVNGWVIGVVEEVVDEVGFGDDVGASIVIGTELALVDELIVVDKKPVTPFSTSPPVIVLMLSALASQTSFPKYP